MRTFNLVRDTTLSLTAYGLLTKLLCASVDTEQESFTLEEIVRFCRDGESVVPDAMSELLQAEVVTYDEGKYTVIEDRLPSMIYLAIEEPMGRSFIVSEEDHLAIFGE